MKVIKRDGKLQDYNENKIMTTIEGASDDARMPLNEADAVNIIHIVNKKIKSLEKEEVTVQQIRELVIEALNEMGFSGIAKTYQEGPRQNKVQ